MKYLIEFRSIIIVAASVAGFLVLLASCNEEPKHVVYVVPDGYRGVLKLRAERSNGQLVKATNGVLTYFFPDSGVLDIQGKLPTLEWHYHEGRYRSGEKIPVPIYGKGVSGDEIALRSLGLTENGKETWDVIGTESDMADAAHKMWDFSPGKSPVKNGSSP